MGGPEFTDADRDVARYWVSNLILINQEVSPNKKIIVMSTVEYLKWIMKAFGVTIKQIYDGRQNFLEQHKIIDIFS